MTRWGLASSTDDELVFVPEGRLPPARGRLAIEPRDDGFVAYAPGPVDVPVETDELDDWEIASASEDEIRLRRGPRPPAAP